MNNENAGLDTDFIEQQRERLQILRDQLAGVERGAREEEQTLQEEYADGPRDSGDAGANVAQQEIDESLQDESEQRRADVERALEKIEEGTYGLSDESGEPIPRMRLEAMPEALYTVEEDCLLYTSPSPRDG